MVGLGLCLRRPDTRGGSGVPSLKCYHRNDHHDHGFYQGHDNYHDHPNDHHDHDCYDHGFIKVIVIITIMIFMITMIRTLETALGVPSVKCNYRIGFFLSRL